KDVTEALYAPPGYVLFMREGNLMAQSFNANRMELSGDAFPVAERIAANPTFGILALSASNTGVLAYRTGGSQAPYLQITWLNRNGTSAGAIGPPGDYASPELSSDGKRLAVRRTLGGNGDVWLLDLIRGVATRFTFDPGFDDFPIWSPNGSRIVFRSQRSGKSDLYEKLSNLSASEEPLSNISAAANAINDWSPDGRFIVYQPVGQASGLWVLPVLGDQKPFSFLQATQALVGEAQISPDGRWLAYISNESGKFEVYVDSFPKPAGKQQISTEGGSQPRWRGDGKELYYIS